MSKSEWPWLQEYLDSPGAPEPFTREFNAMKAEIARLRDVAEAATQMRSACPMDWMHGECDGSQCAPVCCALAALDAEVGE